VNLDGNLTDRLNTTGGITATGDRGQPLRLTVDPRALLAPVGQDGAVGRNTFHAGNVLELDLAVAKKLIFATNKTLTLRADILNFPNRANFGIPVRFLEAPGFGQATKTAGRSGRTSPLSKRRVENVTAAACALKARGAISLTPWLQPGD